MRKSLVFVLAVMSVWLLRGQTVSAQQSDDNAHAELAKALVGAKVTLEAGLAASEREGTPIFGKFELEDGKLQLSIYTMKGDTFSEVIIDHTTREGGHSGADYEWRGPHGGHSATCGNGQGQEGAARGC
jgi:hypothetical protein